MMNGMKRFFPHKRCADGLLNFVSFSSLLRESQKEAVRLSITFLQFTQSASVHCSSAVIKFLSPSDSQFMTLLCD